MPNESIPPGNLDSSGFKLSVVMPVYNEQATLRAVVERVLALPLQMELICVDDGSRDGSVAILKALAGHHAQLRLIEQPRNMGKGAALRRGFAVLLASLNEYLSRQ